MPYRALGVHKPCGRAPLPMLHTWFAVWHVCFLTSQKRKEYMSGLVHKLASPSPCAVAVWA